MFIAVIAAFAEIPGQSRLDVSGIANWKYERVEQNKQTLGDVMRESAERQEIEARTEAIRSKMGQTDPGNFLSAGSGRFVFGQISSYRRDQFMLDTYTGRIWQVGADSNGIEYLYPVKYRKVQAKEDTVSVFSSAVPFATDTLFMVLTRPKAISQPQNQDTVQSSSATEKGPSGGSARTALGILGGLTILGAIIGFAASN
jgi:hypothetical protein